MEKVTFAALLLLQIICTTYVAAAVAKSSSSHGGALKAACRKTPYANFCMTLLQPYATVLKGNDPYTFGHAAISASLEHAEGAQSFITQEEKDENLTADQRAALHGCLENVGYSVEALRQAKAEFEKSREAVNEKTRENHVNKSTNRLTVSSNDQSACYDSLNGAGGEMVRKVRENVDGAAKAGYVAKSLIQHMMMN
ncbi:hypothetical protein BUALT_BualtUnG0028000 [Buddleja alternifolia]|uniref:Pectinesterase inhibitor domain-containing protein n=1 Tax=Buddleja alternifolia TaxID=168488 RepID=A0AAV6W6H0_9LAMI|nr:hypothetical protein BUALT_BualtUnG0028000 [Buddleja alternifolia]